MSFESNPPLRYIFSDFTVSPRRRLLVRGGREIPLIPRYFDLLVLLLRRRQEVVSRQEILDTVWADVVVSDGALSQAVRILRKALEDHPRNPLYIRTVSRHGYRFIYPGVRELPDETPLPSTPPPNGEAPGIPLLPDRSQSKPGGLPAGESEGGAGNPFDNAFRLLLGHGHSREEGDDRRSAAAETLHLLGTGEAIRRLADRPGHEKVRAWMRETRWNVPEAGPVPLFGQPGAWRTISALVSLRLRRAARAVRSRWAAASLGGAAAGILAGLTEGTLLRILAGPDAPWSLPLGLALVGAAIGGIGAAGVGAGLAMAEALARSRRGLALVLLGSFGGGLIGAMAHFLGRSTLESLFGHDLSPVGGGLEGLFLGAAAGLGYALTTPRPGGGGMATPRGEKRILTAIVTGLCCAIMAIGLAWGGGKLGGSSLDYLAHSFAGSQVGLEPIARLFGESGVGPWTRTFQAAFEGLLFGFFLGIGLTHRPRRIPNS